MTDRAIRLLAAIPLVGAWALVILGSSCTLAKFILAAATPIWVAVFLVPAKDD